MFPYRRQISSDNSCLFNAISYCVDKINHNDNSANFYRNIVANEINNNKLKYNTTFLGMPNDEYQTHILNPDNWGGGIELDILANYIKVQISVFDIKNLKTLNFGESNDYSEVIYLLYDGIHYDSLIITYDPQYSIDLDMTRFDINDLEIPKLLFDLVVNLHGEGSYVDVHGMKLKCEDCNKVFMGQPAALDHAQKTGHQNLCQI